MCVGDSFCRCHLEYEYEASKPKGPFVPKVTIPPPAKARRFILRRFEDVSGLSGTGVVAEGVEFVSGMVALSWYGSHQCVNVYHSIRTIIELHGHQNRTVVEWVDA